MIFITFDLFESKSLIRQCDLASVCVLVEFGNHWCMRSLVDMHGCMSIFTR